MSTLLEAILALASETGVRRMQRQHLYTSITRVVTHMSHVLRCGDQFTIAGPFGKRRYTLMQIDSMEGKRIYPMTVDNGRGPAMLGIHIRNKQGLPFASYDEHLFFAEHLPKIIDGFAQVLKEDTQRMVSAELITQQENIERIV